MKVKLYAETSRVKIALQPKYISFQVHVNEKRKKSIANYF